MRAELCEVQLWRGWAAAPFFIASDRVDDRGRVVSVTGYCRGILTVDVLPVRPVDVRRWFQGWN